MRSCRSLTKRVLRRLRMLTKPCKRVSSNSSTVPSHGRLTCCDAPAVGTPRTRRHFGLAAPFLAPHNDDRFAFPAVVQLPDSQTAIDRGREEQRAVLRVPGDRRDRGNVAAAVAEDEQEDPGQPRLGQRGRRRGKTYSVFRRSRMYISPLLYSHLKRVIISTVRGFHDLKRRPAYFSAPSRSYSFTWVEPVAARKESPVIENCTSSTLQGSEVQ